MIALTNYQLLKFNLLIGIKKMIVYFIYRLFMLERKL